MSEPDDLAGKSIVARADALMQRRRTQASSQTPGLELPVLTQKIKDEPDDLPVLTQVASPPPAATSTRPALITPATAPQLDPALIDKLANELTQYVHKRIAAELPSLIEASLQNTLAGLRRQLSSGLNDISSEAIHDFVTEQKKKARR